MRNGLHIHWVWVPAAVLWIAVDWYRYGVLVGLLTILLGVGLVALAESRAGRRRSN